MEELNSCNRDHHVATKPKIFFSLTLYRKRVLAPLVDYRLLKSENALLFCFERRNAD